MIFISLFQGFWFWKKNLFCINVIDNLMERWLFFTSQISSTAQLQLWRILNYLKWFSWSSFDMKYWKSWWPDTEITIYFTYLLLTGHEVFTKYYYCTLLMMGEIVPILSEKENSTQKIWRQQQRKLILQRKICEVSRLSKNCVVLIDLIEAR